MPEVKASAGAKPADSAAIVAVDAANIANVASAPVAPNEGGNGGRKSPRPTGRPTMNPSSMRTTCHVMARGVGRQIIFEDDDDRYFYLQLARKRFAESDVDVVAWCLMSNHVHLLVNGTPEGVSKAMQLIGSIYARRFNKRHGRVGHLFQGRFAKVRIESHRQLLSVVQYIHLNPIKAGGNLETRWSSYREYASHRAPSPLDLTTAESRSRLFESIGGLDRFLSMHEHASTHALKNRLAEPERIAAAHMGLSDYEALQIAKRHLGLIGLHGVRHLEKPARDKLLVELRILGLSARQISRLTSIGVSIVYRARA